MKIVTKLCLALSLLAAPLGAQEPKPVVIGISNQLLRNWSLLYREFSTEWMMCLFGAFIKGQTVDTLVLNFGVLTDTKPDSSTMDYVRPSVPCPESTMGFAHNHPAKIPIPVEELCSLSARDSMTLAQSGVPLSIVVCREDTFMIHIGPSGALRSVCTYRPNENNLRLQCAWQQRSSLDSARVTSPPDRE